MLNIRITGLSSDRKGLMLDGNGHSIAYGREDVQWEVLGGDRGIKRIEAITWKDISGSTNVFTTDYPRARQNTQKKVWFAKVNKYDSEYVYVYTIKWVRDDDTILDFDPIISINPSTSFFKISEVVLLVATAALALLTLQFLRKNKK